jgi:multidrug efflux pump subunit AcrB
VSRLIDAFARNAVAANLLMWLIVVCGLAMLPSLRQEIFPEIKMGMILVTVPYPGASAEEVEESLCIPIEEAVHDLAGVKRVSATAREGLATVAVELDTGADARKLLDEIEARVAAQDDLPEDAEEPVVLEMESFKNVISVALSGDLDELTLRRLGEEMRDEISLLPGVSHVELANVRPYEIAIEVSERSLRRHDLAFDDLVGAVQRSSLDLPGGTLETAEEDVVLRTRSQARDARQFEELILLTHPDGTRLRLGDVAQVSDGFDDSRDSARLDGRPAVLVEVFRSGKERVLDIVEVVTRYTNEKRAALPHGVALDLWRDESVPLRARRDLMLENGAYGLVLVLIVLALFLRLRLAFWVSLGIPISFLGAIALLPATDVSINVISLVAFIIALGLVVDDAIVVGDRVARHEDAGLEGVEAASLGAREVALPVVIAALTSMAMLTPALFLPGVMQQGRPVPVVVIACLTFSLIECLLVLPAHLAHRRRLRRLDWLGPVARLWSRVQGTATSGLEHFIERAYRPLLRRALHNRALTLCTAAAVFALTIGLVAGGWIPFVFLPKAESDYVTAVLGMPEGTPDAVLDEAILRVETAALELREELDREGSSAAPSIFRHVFTSIGSQPEKRRQSFFAPLSWNGFSGPHLAEVQIHLVPREQRSLDAGEVAARWRERVGEIPDVVELTFPVALYSTGDPINIQFAGADAASLRAAADELKRALEAIPGVQDISDSGRHGKRELRLSVRPEAEALGISAADLARQVRQGFHGEEAQRLQRGRDDVPVMVRYPAADRRSLGDLDEVMIRTPSGAEMPFWAVATADVGRGTATIQRADRKRTLRVTADVDRSVTNANHVVDGLEADVLPQILADHPGVGYTLEGHQREQSDFMATLKRGYLMSLVVVFALLAIPLSSYAQPLLIMLAVPFGVVGAFLGHGLLGMEITSFTLIGIVGVSGVVVNDTLVLLHAIRSGREAGVAVMEAIEQACVSRFRPILLTTLTTFLGLTPILLERSTHAQDLKPMAVSLAFGEIVSTAIVLLVVPASYLLLEQAQQWWGGLMARWTAPLPSPPLHSDSA